MAGTYNFTIDAGSTCARDVIYKDGAGVVINITGYLARMKVRRRIAETGPAELSLDSSGNGIAITGAAGKVTFVMTPAQTDALKKGTYFYDLEIESPGGVVTRLIEGQIEVDPSVTRDDT